MSWLEEAEQKDPYYHHCHDVQCSVCGLCDDCCGCPHNLGVFGVDGEVSEG